MARKAIVRAGAVVCSALLMVGLYRTLDAGHVLRILRNADVPVLLVAIGLLAPITMLRAMRFRWLLPHDALSGHVESLRLTLIASAVNVFMPAKAGDFIKSVVVSRQARTPLGLTTAVVVFERTSDLAGLILWCLVGYLVSPTVSALLPPVTWLVLWGVGLAATGILLMPSLLTTLWSMAGSRGGDSRLRRMISGFVLGWSELHRTLGHRRHRMVLFAVALWLVQLVQVWLFTVTVGADLPLADGVAITGIALMVGQLPITVGGIGARDIALVVLLSPYMAPEQAAAVGVLTLSRNLLPPLAALPLLPRYLALFSSHERARATGLSSGTVSDEE